jgi:hypothetical protein
MSTFAVSAAPQTQPKPRLADRYQALFRALPELSVRIATRLRSSRP